MNDLIEIKKIKAIPAKIEGLDFDKVRAVIQNKLKIYGEMVVTDENTPGIKKIIAELRKESKDLNDIKIQIKKELTKNVTEMESEFKTLIGIYDKAILPLDSKVKEFEQREYDKRKENALAYAHGLLEGTGFTLDDLETPEKWFNKGTSESYISEDVTEQIGNLDEKLTAIKFAVDSRNDILGSNGLALGFYTLKNPLQQTLAKINADFEALKRRAEIEKAKQAPKPPEIVPEIVPVATEEEPLPFEPDWGDPVYTAPWDAITTYKIIKVEESDFDRVAEILKANGIDYTVV